jgi:thiamine pyrophosphate-dependent acetolactate synthase large subunit-like protein
MYLSDAVVHQLHALGCRYLPLNPGASFRGIHDSLVNVDGPRPEIILCTHEGIAVATAHAYAKATNDLGWVILHDLVGLMHGSMGIYNAWCDRTPLVALGGGGPADPADRRPVDWFHSANTQSLLVRPFVKWDEDPIAPQATLDAIVQASKIALDGPTGPTYVTVDTALAEQDVDDLVIRSHDPSRDGRFVPNPDAIRRAARSLVDARMPLIVAGRVGLDPASTELLVRLADVLGSAIRDERNLSAIPTDFELNLNSDGRILADCDVFLAIDLHDLNYVLDGIEKPSTLIDLSANPLGIRSWSNAGAGVSQVDIQLTGDALLGLALLIDEVILLIDEESAAGQRARRLVWEVHEAVRHLPWLLTLRNTRSWPEGIWKFDRAGRFLGHSGGGGIGYGPGALLGGGLAARDRGEFAVGIIGDGDLMYSPGAIWSAVHHRVPMLIIVNNNKSYLNDELHQAIVAKDRTRPAENAHVGTTFTDPPLGFAEIAKGHGAVGIGPVVDPNELPGVLARAVELVLGGAVVLVDVNTEGA